MSAAAYLSVLTVVGILVGATTARAEREEPVRSLLEMRHDRVIIQEYDLSCGAAVLATLLTHQLGTPTSEREVALQLISREEYLRNPELVRLRQGFSLLDMKRVASRFGYKGVGFGSMSLEDLVEKAPVIVPISPNDYSHFVIFRGMAGDRVLLADPAWGNRTMTIREFRDVWINHERIGRVGFVVINKNGVELPNRLAPSVNDFVTFN